MSLVLYLLFAGGVELGRMIFVSQVLQDAARIAARELSVTPIPAANDDGSPKTFEQALTYHSLDADRTVDVQRDIWNPNLLVVDLDAVHDEAVNESTPTNAVSDDDVLKNFFDSMPIVNRALRPIFIGDNPTIDGVHRRFLRYPGALLTVPPDPIHDPLNLTRGFTVGIPLVNSGRNPDEAETISWIQVLSEVRSTSDPNCGPFPITPLPDTCPTGIPPGSRGIAAIAVNYPFQSAALSSFKRNPPSLDADGNVVDPLPPNVGQVFVADDAAVTDNTNSPPNLIDGARLPGSASDAAGGTYGGQFGLGIQRAFAKDVRPFRRVLLGQAMFRREVIP